MIKAKDCRIIRKPEDIVLISGMRSLRYGVSHCTSGPLTQPVQEILNYWERHNGWKNPGYHYLITADGTVYELMRIDKISNGVQGHNSNSVHFCYTGGIDNKGNPIDNRTQAQKASQLMIVKRLKALLPNLIFLGHRDFSTDKNGNGIIERWEWIKACPSLDFRAWLATQGLDKVIIPERIVYKLHEPLIKNDTVYAIQLGLGMNPDSWFGQNTSDMVKAYQKRNGLTVDGIVGEGTARSLAGNIKPTGQYYIDLLLNIKNR